MKIGSYSFSGTVAELAQQLRMEACEELGPYGNPCTCGWCTSRTEHGTGVCDCMWCDRDRSDLSGEPVGRDLEEIVSALQWEPPAWIAPYFVPEAKAVVPPKVYSCGACGSVLHDPWSTCEDHLFCI